MDMAPIYYCILKNYKGRKKEFLGNTNFYLVPMPEERYVYLGVLGELEDHEHCYMCRLILNMEAAMVGAVLEGEVEEFGDRFKVIETLNCEASLSEEGVYDIKLLEQGEYIQSDLILGPYTGRGKKAKPMFILGGHLCFSTSPI
jgi:hypothetical protein